MSGQALVESPDVDMVSFTGSTAVGMQIGETAGRGLKRQLLELGGKGAAIVFEDADIKSTIGMIGSVWTFHSGQICTAPTRAIVHRSVYDHVVEGLAKMATVLKVGDPLEKDTVIGPLITEAHRNRVEGYIQSGRDEGGEVVAGGGRPAHLEKGWYLEPTLIANCRPGHAGRCRRRSSARSSWRCPFDDEDEGIAIANGTEFGLYDYVFSQGHQPARCACRAACGPATSGSTRCSATRRRRSAARSTAASVATAARSASTRTPSCSPSSGPAERGADGIRDLPLGSRADAGRRRTRSGSSSTGGCSTRSTVAVTGDRNGFKYSWFTEHHFLEEYSHVSASEVLMGYVAGADRAASTSARGSSTSRRR